MSYNSANKSNNTLLQARNQWILNENASAAPELDVTRCYSDALPGKTTPYLHLRKEKQNPAQRNSKKKITATLFKNRKEKEGFNGF